MNENPFDLGLTLRGVVLPNGKPVIDFWIEPLQQFVRALLDTGATEYSIQEELAIALKLKQIQSNTTSYLALNNPIEVDVYRMEFRLKGIEEYLFADNFHTIPFNFMYPIIIGTNFLKRCKSFEIDYKNEIWTIEI